jgi:drug/metabolite transporter (DMT)-like permease
MKAILGKRVGQDGSNLSGVLFLNFNIFFVAALTVFAFFVGQINTFFEISSYSLILSVLFALFLLFTYVTQMRALNTGAASLGTLIYSCGFLVPIFYSALFLDESITLYQLIGILLLAISFGFIIPPKKGERFSLKWLMFAVLSMLGSGSVAVVQKIHQSSAHRGELTMFLIIAFICSFVFSAVSLLVEKKKDVAQAEERANKSRVWLLGALFAAAGVGIALNNLINLYLSGVVASAVFFPIVNGGGLILITAASVALFKEKLTARQWLGLALGIAATLLLCI